MATTDAKAKYLRSEIEQLLTVAKKNTLASRRAVYKKTANKKTGDLIIKTAEKYKDKKGGYVRLTKVGYRKCDGALLTQIEFI